MGQEKVMFFRNHRYLFSKHESKDQMTDSNANTEIHIIQFGIIISFDSAYCTVKFKKTLTCSTVYFQTCFL